MKQNCHAELVSASVPCRELPLTLARFRNKFGMTPTESVLCLVNRLSVKKCAFTMAEILLSLTIIGVVAAPLPVNNDSAAGSYQAAIGACNKMDTESRLPNKDELSAIFFNRSLVGNMKDAYYWSGTVNSSTSVWSQNMGGGNRIITAKTLPARVRCIKR